MAILKPDMMAQIRQLEIRTRHLVDEVFSGEYLSVFKGRGIEFDEVRQYQFGDDVRAIDWNVTARTNEVHIKRYIEERELTLMLMVDASGSNNFGSVERFKQEAIIELASILAFAATNNNDKVGLMIFTDHIELLIPPRKGRKHVVRIIRELMAYQPQHQGTDIQHALDAINRFLKRRGIVVLVSDFLEDPGGYKKALTIASHRHDLIAVDVSDPMESQIANVGVMALEDAESGTLVEIDTSSMTWQKGFRQQLEQREQAKKHVFNSAKVDRLEVSTPDDNIRVLMQFFEYRLRRRARR